MNPTNSTNRWLSQPWFRPDGKRGEVRAGLRRMTDDLGLDYFSCVLLQDAETQSPGLPPERLSGYPREWALRYEEKGYHHADPVLHLARRATHPFFWEQETLLRTVPGRERRVLREAGVHGILAGLAIPVHGPHGSIAVLHLSDSDAGRIREAVRCNQGRLLAAALDAHGFLLKEARRAAREGIVGIKGTGGAVPVLAGRERECLAWTLEGLGAREVALETGLSPSSVHHYLSNAQRKLGCGNKFQAAVRANRMGLL